MSEQSILKSLKGVTSKLWPESSSGNQSIFQTLVAPRVNLFLRSRRLFAWMTVFMSTLTLGAMIQKYCSTQYGFSFLPVGVFTSCLITFQWLLAVYLERTNGKRSTICLPDSR